MDDGAPAQELPEIFSVVSQPSIWGHSDPPRVLPTPTISRPNPPQIPNPAQRIISLSPILSLFQNPLFSPSSSSLVLRPAFFPSPPPSLCHHLFTLSTTDESLRLTSRFSNLDFNNPDLDLVCDLLGFVVISEHDAVKALNIYKRAGQQPPPSFLATMEEYVKEAPQTGSVTKRMEYQEMSESEKKLEEPPPAEEEKQVEEVEEEKLPEETQREQEPKIEADPPPLIDTGAFLIAFELALTSSASDMIVHLFV
ncbi:hypothetical protein Droror1_Dr00016456 [Drosera rotundifolia]